MKPEITSKVIKQVGSVAFGAFIFVVLLWVLVRLHDTTEWLACVLGLSMGWPVGILLSPYQTEQTIFKEYGRVVAAFVTGFLVSKADRVFEVWIERNRGHALFDEQLASRWMVGLTSFMLAMVVTYVVRKYFRWGPNAQRPEDDNRPLA
jgi:hypothetical protein